MSLCVNHSTGDIPRSCAGLREQPAPVEEAKPQPQQPAQPQPTVPTVPGGAFRPSQPGPIEHQISSPGQPAPRVRHYDWNGAVQPMVGQMLQAGGSMPAVFCWLTA